MSGEETRDETAGPPDDPRAPERRRHAVLAGYGAGGDARLLLRDPDPTVRAAALGALERQGALDDETLVVALGDPAAGVRRRACTLVGRRRRSPAPDAGVVERVVALMDDDDPSVVELVAWVIGELGAPDGAGVAELCRVAGGHQSALCREAAVAALGAVGAPETLPVVLGALEDTVNIRRRAAVALAAFDDPRATEGLRRCLGDRDWQTRQAAEELLAES